jgi:hypothetical protein
MVDARFGTGVGAWLMHGLVQLWCVVDAWFGTGVGAWLMHLVWYRLWYTVDVWYGTG